MNIKEQVLAYRYARAFMNAYYASITKEDRAALSKAVSFLKIHQRAFFLMRLSVINADVRIKTIDGIRKKIGISEPFNALICLLIEHKRISLLDEILQALQELVRDRDGITHFNVQTSVLLSELQKNKIKDFLENKLAIKVICDYSVNTSLIAGIAVSNQKVMWQNSIRKKLECVRQCIDNARG